MKFIQKTLKKLKGTGKLVALYRLQGYCLAKGYHFYTYNHCANNDYLITRIEITDKENKRIAGCSCDIHCFNKIAIKTQYC